MHSTEPRFRRQVVWASGLLVLLLVYGLLCLADLGVARWLDRQITLANAPARAIEARRVEQQDEPQLVKAQAAGHRMMLFPALFEQGAFLAMVRRHGVLPLGTQPSAPLAYCNEGDGLVTYASDRFGFRNADAAWDVPEVNVTLLGDSFVQGACVAEQHTMAAHLAAAGYTVINLGTAGNNGLMHAAVARAYLPTMRPRHAVLVFYANDNEDEEDSVLRPWALPDEPDYLVREQGRLRPGPAYQRLAALWTEADAEALRQFARAQGGQAEQNGTAAAGEPRSAPKWLALTAIRTVIKTAYRRWTGGALPWSSRLAIDTLATQCQRAGCQPALAYIPNSPFWRPDPRAEGYRQALWAYAAQSHPEMAWIDLSPGLSNLGDAAYARMGPHLSAAGYAAAAQSIEQSLRQSRTR